VTFTVDPKFGYVKQAASALSSSAITYQYNRRPTGSADTLKSPVAGLPDINTHLRWDYESGSDNLALVQDTAGAADLVYGYYYYDDASRLKNAMLAASYPKSDISFDYDSAGQAAKATRANGVNTVFTRNDAGELTGAQTVNAALPGEGYLTRSYERNTLGLI